MPQTIAFLSMSVQALVKIYQEVPLPLLVHNVTLRLLIQTLILSHERLQPLSILVYCMTLSIITFVHSSNSSCIEFIPFIGFLYLLDPLHSRSTLTIQSYTMKTCIQRNTHSFRPQGHTHRLSSFTYIEHETLSIDTSIQQSLYLCIFSHCHLMQFQL